ncbi:MAG: YihA family ribosome biogenesis GTP-binding protein [Bacteroidetes bacterium GWF2_38_335]|nr:MAG: YihA family ribosome biogenesis GTP-binding protein [Bacteroidetes bacterium GWF2_38_335]OFY81071.1 MAG: YihA family ribosome biogenesis GTP-binding protein [Bacteroidetes bacterium RIFOXYA12_FULL_38_20]HBS87611.1 YihA family ribosome biogenesis GTP-binding protein [Bacteroidales bacterium]
MIIKTAEFVCSSPDYRDCPESMLKEFAFIGRSNVGKSSLINMLVNNRKLAKTSSSPGKTQLINHFLINNSWYIVDLPGFGYARVSKTTRYKWGKMLSIYLTKRETLACIFVLIDSRHKPQRIDLEFMSWLAEKNVPFCMVFTKTDKLSKAELIKNLSVYKTTMLETWDELPLAFASSAISGAGRDDILSFIDGINEE